MYLEATVYANGLMYDTVSYPLQEESQLHASPADKGAEMGEQE